MDAPPPTELPSPFFAAMGFELIEWREGAAVIAMEIARAHINRGGVLHGGVLMSLIDTACGYAGTWCAVPGHVRGCVTLAMTTAFIAPAQSGRIRAVARVLGGGRKIFTASAEVLDRRDKLLASGQGTFRYRRGSEDIAGQPL
jgi:uncharacterized protein (TIGR00369 family)